MRSEASENKTNFNIHILVNNTRVIGIPERQIFLDGNEMHFATKYLHR